MGLVGVEEPDAAARCELLERHLGPGGLQVAPTNTFPGISTPGASGSVYWFNSSVFPTVTAAKFAPEATFSTFFIFYGLLKRLLIVLPVLPLRR